ncbi:oligoendopeptidase, pepF/M3 family [Bellilinea caldifistulae]|uniref:Oligoendopeptidase F n=1 Tax=Bellilinea caldifistulae TaxID=360411 RepID=A0A0P6WPX7_9CHLR|nr:M3 family oligoendopeptidase [Bellilinea caldifistulae]KPL72127.1 oligoendopeptidase F [Bellilinea caldifistulae]GAP09169.1 oligoendopeptidase, pepF/M3 family [Bellilinea caldifistulae]
MTTTDTRYPQTRWSLSDLFPAPNSSELENAFQTLDQLVAEFETYRGSLREDISVEEFLKILQQLEKIQNLGARLYAYAGLLFSEDTQNQTAQTLTARVEQFVADLTNRTLFFNLWWKDLSDEAAARLMPAAGDLEYWLEALRHFKPHTLSEAEEKIINIKNVTGVNALQMLYSSITNRYTFKITVDGEEKELTRGELMVYVRGADPDLRAAAYQELYRVYGNDGTILGQIYQALVRDWRNEQINLRKHRTPMSARNLVNDLPDEVVDTLLDVCASNVDVFQRYFRLKARWLKMNRLRRYDIYAPVAKADKHYPFDQAAVTVFDAFREFDPQIAELARRVFEEKHLDSEVRKGKRSGAFCWGAVPELTPWVLLNYQGRADDMATMAHELGHAIHSMLASHHSVLTWHSNLPLAETASTFGEMLLIDRLLKSESDPAVRRDLLFRQIDDAYATIQRQVFFALFERDAHEMVHQGASVDELANAYMENLRRQFGDAVDVSNEFRWEWVSIPHIFDVPFYVYAYAFGQLLVFSLYQQYKAEGDSFKPRYLKILSTGGSKAPIKVLSEAGVDVSQPSFWQGGYDFIRQQIEALESIPIE